MADELIDVVNDQDIVIGQELRSVVHRRGLQHRGVHVLLSTGDDTLLIQRRSKDKIASPSLLDCSVSEHVLAGEDYKTAANRGMKEELGVMGVEIQEIITFRMNYGPNDNEISRLFRGLIDPTLVKYDPVEIEQVLYSTLDELIKKMELSEDEFCRWFIQIIKWSIGKPSELKVLHVPDNIRLPWLSIK